MSQENGGHFFRESWITGVKQHFPGTPKAGYIAPWSEISQWEQESAAAVYAQVYQFVQITGGQSTHLSREQKGRFVAICWIGQIFKHFTDPKDSYIADWEQLPEWQRETDADIFEVIEESVL